MKKNVFVLGDSICIYYTPFLLPLLESDFECQTKKGRAEAMKDLDVPIKANAGNTRDILNFLDLEEENGNLTYDYLLFNSGLHDLVYPFDKEAGVLKTAPRTPIEKYPVNLGKILDIMAAHGIKPVFITTTPVDDVRHSRTSFRRFGADVIRYNEVALRVMAERGIPVIDLFSFTDALPDPKYRDHVHYLDEVAEKQAEFINAEFRKILENY